MKVCWCDMCGYTASMTDEQAKDEDVKCPSCDEVEEFTLLCIGDEFPEHIAEDEPLPKYKGVS